MNLPTRELEARLLFSAIVAGKSASFAEAALKRFLDVAATMNHGPFEHIRWLCMENPPILLSQLHSARTGNYNKLHILFKSLAMESAEGRLDLRKITAPQLEKFHGIGPKTARFFILWTRPTARHAALDTHVLKWMSYLGYIVPKSTPTGAKYAWIETLFIAECDKRKQTTREIDAAIWDWCSKNRAAAVAGQWPKDLQRLPP